MALIAHEHSASQRRFDYIAGVIVHWFTNVRGISDTAKEYSNGQ